jgi:uncharacterized protein
MATRAAPEAEEAEAGPLRRCVVTRESLPKPALVRLVVGPGGALLPDIEGRLPGRGLWITARRDIVERALSKRLLQRAAGAEIAVPPDLADRIQALLRRRCLDLIGLARRAGQAVAGYEKVKAVLERDEAALLVQAADGSPEQRGKLRARTDRTASVALFTRAELAEIFGRETAVHAAILPGTLAERLRQECGRLAGFVNDTGASAGRTLTGFS